MSFEPKILGFLCNWCSYAGADLAGVSRVQYPPNVRVVRVMCSGRVDPEFVLEGLISGLDGVIVLGCHPGDCHYLEGNYEEEKKFRALEKMLAKEGLEKRVFLDWVSASEGARFGEVITNFVNQIKEQGPTPVKDDKVILKKLKAMQMAMAGNKVRALVGRQRRITEQENVYGERVPKEKFDAGF
jgi:F420-non-reducing hydrogenase iron-sulfur subunit